jgi:hypothetical protein
LARIDADESYFELNTNLPLLSAQFIAMYGCRLGDPHSNDFLSIILEIALMNTVNPNTATANSGTTADTKQILLKDIGAKWNKFSEQELGALKSKDQLVTEVVTKYSIDKTQALRDVDAVMKGRQL